MVLACYEKALNRGVLVLEFRAVLPAEYCSESHDAALARKAELNGDSNEALSIGQSSRSGACSHLLHNGSSEHLHLRRMGN